MFCYIKEFEIMREVLFALQGLNGRIIRQDADGRFTITKSHIHHIDPTQRMLLEKLTSFGWLVNKIKSHINSITKDPFQGKVSQCLAAALNNELYEYYHMVTQIEQQLQKCANQDNGRTRASTPTSELYAPVELRALKSSATYESLHTAIVANGYATNGHQVANSDDGFGSQMYSVPSSNASPTVQPITLHHIHLWSLDHYFRLKTLTMLVECCKGERGGHLAQIVYRFIQQGDKQIKAIITRILSQVVVPIKQMLSQWIFHGEIQDPYDEFFICPREHIIKDYMMPGFISTQQAYKILATGKAVNMLRKVCSDSGSVPGYEDLKKSFESTSIENLFSSFEHLLNSAHKEVSRKALELLFVDFKLRSHFRALRHYLLLGQGDFIRHLMDLLQVELDKPSTECRFNNLLSVLECAMRSTNAQFDEPDVTSRIDFRLLETNSPNATGWDIFSLAYKLDGPISVIFTEEKSRDYIDIFRQLWRTKRMEHVLTSLWSSQMYHCKQKSNCSTLSPLFHKINILLNHMIHSMQHIQNFIMFEVVECSWVELVAATDVARDLDDVIAAHDTYLKKIKKGTMCQKDTLFECILEFQQLMISLWRELDLYWEQSTEANKRKLVITYEAKVQILANSIQADRQIALDT